MHAVPNRSRRLLASCCAVVFCIPGAAMARDPARGLDLPVPQPILTDNRLLWQVAPDECFNGIGVDYPPIDADGTCSQGQPKANQSYIWSLVEANGRLWFGTMANTACVLNGTRSVTPIMDVSYVCEYGESQYARTYPSLTDTQGDWRPPRIYSWDLATGTPTEREVDGPLLQTTLGLRSAGAVDGNVFLAGASRLGDAINFFAYDAATGKYLGACTRSDYNYVRGSALVDGVLYVGVGSTTHGAILRWMGPGGARAMAFNYCNNFVEVGRVAADVANITGYTGGDGKVRLAITTVPIRASGGGDIAQPSATSSGAGTGVWISPPIPEGGLTPDQLDGWRQVWSPLQYDPDPIVSRYGYSGGAIRQYDGWVYWGTIHNQNSLAQVIEESCTKPFCFGTPNNPREQRALNEGVYRSTSLWRGRNLEDPRKREIQLLYGESQLPVCCVAPKTFGLQPTGWTPLYGPSGFGNRGNEYVWTLAVFDGRLFIGTYDASVLQGPPAEQEIGADLWRIDSSGSPAVNENYTGLGDRGNYGIRILHPLEDGSGLVVGLANPANLAPGGGWELRLLQEGQ
jgi:hypothetical protein